jgi:hypothetical protein
MAFDDYWPEVRRQSQIPLAFLQAQDETISNGCTTEQTQIVI